MKKVIISLAVAFYVVSISSASIAAEVYGIEIQEWGIYDTKAIEEKGLAPGRSVSVDDIKLLKLTYKIPARLGTSFGLKYYVNGHPPGAQVNITQRWLFPYPGVKHPKTGKLTHYYDETIPTPIGSTMQGHYLIVWSSAAIQKFTKASDLVPGEWKLQLWYGRKKLKEKTFTIYEP
jgi:Domain of unknown function (DUF3859)